MELNLLIDSDSGYVSNPPGPANNVDFIEASDINRNNNAHLYLSEDALLENPTMEESLNTSYDSVIFNSQESVATVFSGLEESTRESPVIPQIPEIVVEKNDFDTSTSSNMSLESPRSSKIIENNISLVTSDSPVTPAKANVIQRNLDISPDLFSENEIESRRLSPRKTDSNLFGCDINVEMKRLGKVKENLSGVCPPPSVTITRITIDEMLQKISENKDLFCTSQSKLMNITLPRWPEILKISSHGLHYNKSGISEEYEYLCLKYAERYVGIETHSTCTVFHVNTDFSPQSKKLKRSKWTSKSPGRRLSHIARRRITFSNTNLMSGNSSSILGSRARQILVDAKKMHSANKAKTPSKSPFKKRKLTPGSSGKKRAAKIFPETQIKDNKMSYKRALFQSPPSSLDRSSTSSPARKRTRLDSDCDLSQTESSDSSNLNSLQKRKLQFAVYEALRQHNVTHLHPQFKIFASNLARVTRRLLPLMKQAVSVTEKLRKISRFYSYAVVKGKSVDDIVGEFSKTKSGSLKFLCSFEIDKPKNGSKMEGALQDKANIVGAWTRESESANLNKAKPHTETKIDRIRKVICFEDGN